ncbi:MAG: autotransporter outer membrane beta-barrel domain-containing protein [Blastochloris sp.]|nr:autotransporter outer membrane beta-barrel domain-containing protein [Blastochloris sp.]
MLGLSYSHTMVDSFQEVGPAALSVARDEADSFRSSLGGRVRHAWDMGWGRLIPEVRASWVHEYLNDRRNINASFVDLALPGTFATPTANPDRDFGIFGAGISAEIGTDWTLSLDYDVEAGRDEFVAHQLSAGIRYSF